MLIFANYNALFSVCKIWLIIPDPYNSGSCYKSSSLPACYGVQAQEEATDGKTFCYKHQLTLYD